MIQSSPNTQTAIHGVPRKDPRAAKIFARTLFRDMDQAGLSQDQILAIASELIGLVTEKLKIETSVANQA